MRIGSTNRVKESACINCGAALTAATAVEGVGDEERLPEPGDLTVCMYCKHLMMFADDLTLRNLTDDEMKEVAGDPRMLAVTKGKAR